MSLFNLVETHGSVFEKIVANFVKGGIVFGAVFGSASIALLGLLAKSNASSQLINLCSGQGRSIQEAATQILDLSGFPIDTLTFDETNSTFPRLVGSNARLLKDFPSLQITWNPRPLD